MLGKARCFYGTDDEDEDNEPLSQTCVETPPRNDEEDSQIQKALLMPTVKSSQPAVSLQERVLNSNPPKFHSKAQDRNAVDDSKLGTDMVAGLSCGGYALASGDESKNSEPVSEKDSQIPPFQVPVQVDEVDDDDQPLINGVALVAQGITVASVATIAQGITVESVAQGITVVSVAQDITIDLSVEDGDNDPLVVADEKDTVDEDELPLTFLAGTNELVGSPELFEDKVPSEAEVPQIAEVPTKPQMVIDGCSGVSRGTKRMMRDMRPDEAELLQSGKRRRS